ncbi:MAG: glucose-6-phosphate dehydrogenase [Spirochaetota bacterium]|nr:MAG: glucose-6-phosphate dehydrogenase [Spirochaetota bacterium]
MSANNHSTVRGSFCIEEYPEPTAFVIFGASGDLTSRKLIPSLYNLFQKNLIPKDFYILGCARSPLNDESFRKKVENAIGERSDSASDSKTRKFSERCFYISGGYDADETYKELKKRLEILDKKFLPERNHIFHLATPPSIYPLVIKNLGLSGLSKEGKSGIGSVHVIVEKPFGSDLDSAMELENILKKSLSEHQIYRIDHYLGKDTVQNILLFRFANSIFEPIWNRRYIDNIQITVAESIGVEHRAGFFEQAGLLRDMFQNHMMQLISLVAMESPISFDADRVRDEKVKLLRAIRPFKINDLNNTIIRGQYGPGIINGKEVVAYRDEEGVDPNSKIETYVAAKIMIENWRWQGVPFFLRTGRRLKRKASKIAVQFKAVPHSMFYPLTTDDLNPNVLIFHVQPEEGISLRIQAKHPGPKLCMDALEMEFKYSEVIHEGLPDAYERLLLDCMVGDPTLFIRRDDMEVAWSFITPVLKAWERDPECKKTGPLHMYPAGSWGPDAIEELVNREGRSWINI